MSNTREQIIQATCVLLEKQGYPATGLNEIIAQSGAPKGSLYHYFPDGKEQIVSEAVRFSGNTIIERMRSELERHPDAFTALHDYLLRLAGKVEEKDFTAGNPLTIVAIESAGVSKRISQACREVYLGLMAVLQARLESAGIPPAEAAERARLVLAALEGAILLSRVLQDTRPLRALAEHVQDYLPKLNASVPTTQSG